MAIFQVAISSISASPSAGVLAQRQADVFQHRQRAEQAAVLEHHAPALAQGQGASSVMSCRSTPSTRMVPAFGRCSRIISRSSVDLPEPLPPITAKISARRTSQVD
jgi:hypothetical protein